MVIEDHELTGLEGALSVGLSFVVTKLDFKHVVVELLDNRANLSLHELSLGKVS